MKQRPEFAAIAADVERYGYVETTIAETVPILEILAKHLSAAWALETPPDEALQPLVESDTIEKLRRLLADHTMTGDPVTAPATRVRGS